MSAHNFLNISVDVHTCTCTSMAVIFSTSPDCSLAQGWTGGVHSNFEMTKDPQPGSGKCGPHTFCSGHACTCTCTCVQLSFLYSTECYRCFSHSRLNRGYGRILLDD